MLNEILECGVNALAVNIIHYRDVGELGIQAKLGKAAFLHFPCWCHSPPRLSSPSILAHLPFLHLLLVNGRLWWPLVERPYCQQEEKTVIFEYGVSNSLPYDDIWMCNIFSFSQPWIPRPSKAGRSTTESEGWFCSYRWGNIFPFPAQSDQNCLSLPVIQFS